MKTTASFQSSKNILVALGLAFACGNVFSQDYGKSFVDYNAGTIQPGDTLQIRATFVVKSGTFTNCSFTDVLPANTTYVPGSLCILTNEGKTYKQFTDASGDDAGTVSGSNITINMGTGATSSTGQHQQHQQAFFLWQHLHHGSFLYNKSKSFGSIWQHHQYRRRQY